MTQPSDRWARIEQLFHDAQSVPPAERDTWLSAQCADDAELHREVRSLLAADTPAGDTFARVVHEAAAETARDAAPPADGRRVGPYRLLRAIGHGGMGT